MAVAARPGAALIVLLGYVVIRLFMRQWYWVGEYNYLTPLYSPCISESCTPGSAHFGTIFGDLPIWIPLPIVVFPVLLGFRGTCYYYRKAVYRSILQSPTACAVAEPAPRYRGESRFFVFMNSHRYFFYLASLLLLINTYDAVLAFFPRGEFGFGLGSIILVVNVAAAVGLHAGLPRVPAHRRRQAQALLAQPAALRHVEPHLDAQRAAHAVRLGVAGERDPDRRLHHGRLGRMDLRPADRGVNDMAEHSRRPGT